MSDGLTSRPCPTCGRDIPADALRCKFCFARLDPLVRRETKGIPSPSAQLASPVAPRSDWAERIRRRYADAYIVARAIDGWGATVKVIGLIAAILLAVGSVYGAVALHDEKGGAVLIFGFFVSGLVGGTLYVLGILISAQGQILKATLDSAINTSPFLSSEDRATALSL